MILKMILKMILNKIRQINLGASENQASSKYHI